MEEEGGGSALRLFNFVLGKRQEPEATDWPVGFVQMMFTREQDSTV